MAERSVLICASVSMIMFCETVTLTFNWLFEKKQNGKPNDLFWGMARHWKPIKATLRTGLQRGNDTFKTLKKVQLQDVMLVSIRHLLDAIVIKAHNEVITPLFKVNLDLSAASHLQGNGGLKVSVTLTTP